VFFDPELRASRPSQATTWQKTRYISRIATAGDHARGPLLAIPQVTAVDDQFGTHRLELENWEYGTLFDPPPKPRVDLIEALERLVSIARLDEHLFFGLATTPRAALGLGMSQELVIRNAFSQCSGVC
jgi:hypothetical protein